METSNRGEILVLNGGSSSIKFAVFSADDTLRRVLGGTLSRHEKGSWVMVSDSEEELFKNLEDRSPAVLITEWLAGKIDFDRIKVIGHRIVQGTEDSVPELITNEVLNDLEDRGVIDPDHIPSEVELIRLMQRDHSHIRQIACYDTTFHRDMPAIARILAIPKRYKVTKLGFHGLSYSYLSRELYRLEGEGALGKVILLHLGSGASITALLDGKSVDTSMGFTPASGLVMGTRPGDMDPGVLRHMMISEDLSADELNRVVNHECGLLALSGFSADMRELLANMQNQDARFAVALFCYQIRKWIGAYAAVLNGLHMLVFSGGIGERVPEIRAAICNELGFLGLELDAEQNKINAPLISRSESRVRVRVIPTNEEEEIARKATEFILN